MHAIKEEPKVEQDTKNVETDKLLVTSTKDKPQQSTTTASARDITSNSDLTTKADQQDEQWTLPAATTFTNPMPPGTSTSIPTAPQTSTSAPPATPLSATLPTDRFASPSATAADMPDIDIDSMFEEFANAEPGDNLFGQTDANVDVADVSSLLTGIDSFTNIQNGDAAGGGATSGDSQTQKVEAGGDGDFDFAMLDLTAGEDGQRQEDIQFGDNSFDELFEFGEWAGGEGGGGEEDGGLDESWLKSLE